MERSIIIALTGGPCAGKTSALEAIREEFGDDVVIIPEIASGLLASGSYPMPNPWSQEWQDGFQAAIIRGQKEAEAKAKAEALQKGAKVIICDRGLLDGAAYLAGGLSEFCSKFGVDEAKALASYEMVIHLESLSTLNPRLYEELMATNPSRFEPVQEAAKREMALRQVWAGHKNQHQVSIEGADLVADRVVDLLCQYFKREIEKKYLLNAFPSCLVGKKGKKITQGYLSTGKPEIRLRDKDGKFFFTVKGEGDLIRPEVEREITADYFEDFWPFTEGKRILKTRYKLVCGELIFEVDEYYGQLEGLFTAEVEFYSKRALKKAVLPPEIMEVFVADVTKDKRYKNKNLAISGKPDFEKGCK